MHWLGVDRRWECEHLPSSGRSRAGSFGAHRPTSVRLLASSAGTTSAGGCGGIIIDDPVGAFAGVASGSRNPNESFVKRQVVTNRILYKNGSVSIMHTCTQMLYDVLTFQPQSAVLKYW